MEPARSEINTLFERQFDAIRAKDLDRLMSFYSSDVVYYDVVPPLRFAGTGRPTPRAAGRSPTSRRDHAQIASAEAQRESRPRRVVPRGSITTGVMDDCHRMGKPRLVPGQNG
jgi:hypothetical protein